ncbi:MAG: hypothetical protein HRT53_21060 [Colwellia sp.]|nr:hypothetical protein [Colwellia sp.]
MKNVVLISCVKTKRSEKSSAMSMYTSSLFKYNLSYAQQLAPYEIYILSAQHGLLKLDDQIAPYEKTLNKMLKDERVSWSEDVISQLKETCELHNTNFIFLAGVKYREHLIPHMKNYSIPLEGMRLGMQLQKLKELTS